MSFIPISNDEGPNTSAWGRLYVELDGKPIWYDEDPPGVVQGFAWTYAEFLEGFTRDWSKICTWTSFEIDLSKYFNGIDVPSFLLSKMEDENFIRIDTRYERFSGLKGGRLAHMKATREFTIQVLAHVADQIAAHLDTQDGKEATTVRENWRIEREKT